MRDDATLGELSSHKKRTIDDKESIKWLKSVEALTIAREAAPQTTFVSVGDREADVYELFAMDVSLASSCWRRVAGARLLEPGGR